MSLINFFPERVMKNEGFFPSPFLIAEISGCCAITACRILRSFVEWMATSHSALCEYFLGKSVLLKMWILKQIFFSPNGRWLSFLDQWQPFLFCCLVGFLSHLTPFLLTCNGSHTCLISGEWTVLWMLLIYKLVLWTLFTCRLLMCLLDVGVLNCCQLDAVHLVNCWY